MGVFDCEARRREIIQFCQSLVRTPSVNGVNVEKKTAELIARFSIRNGFHVDVIAREPDRPNVLVRVGPEGEPALLIVAHTDTVSAGRAEVWTHPPFGAEIAGGRLYGRGTVDNKGGIAAGLAALVMLNEDSSVTLPRPIVLACVPDEESGATGRLGIRHLKEVGKLCASGAVYTYPGMHRIIIGHRGVLRLRIIAHGKAIHSGSTRWRKGNGGCNAVTGMAEFLLRIEQLRFNDVSENGSCDNFAVATPTIIKGGTEKSVVPDYCEVAIDIRLGSTVLRAEIEETIRQAAREVARKRYPLRFEIGADTWVPPTSISSESQIVSALRKSVKQVIGREPALAISGPANESYILNGFGIPTCVLGPNGGHAHAADEYVVIDSIFKAAAVYALTAHSMM